MIANETFLNMSTISLFSFASSFANMQTYTNGINLYELINFVCKSWNQIKHNENLFCLIICNI